MVLLDLLAKKARSAGTVATDHGAAMGYKLVVAHLDHGIREDSPFDRQLVQETAKKYGIPFVYHEAQLGPGASEDAARKARYDFLRAVQKASNASSIITAHHHDDALETAVINLLRGTNRKGLSALQSSDKVKRPLLHLPKSTIKKYAADQGLAWHEDSTNSDIRYVRNYVRHKILPQLKTEDKQKLRDIVTNIALINRQIDTELMNYLHVQPGLSKLDRAVFIRLPHAVAREVMAAWLRNHGLKDFDQKTLERLVVGAKTHAPGKAMDVVKNSKIVVHKQHLALLVSDR